MVSIPASSASAHSSSIRSIFEGGKLELVPGMPGREVEQVLVRLNRAGDVSNHALAFYLHDLDSTRSCQELGFPNAVSFARARLGMEKSRAYELIRAGGELRSLPRINAATASGELAWSRLRLLLGIATPETEEEWIDLAKSAGFEELKWKVKAARRGLRPPGRGKGTPNVRMKVQAFVDVLGYKAWQLVKAKFEAESGERLSCAQVLLHLVQLGLALEPDGKVPGWERIAGSPFRLHAEVDPKSGEVALLTEEGSVPLDPEAARRFQDHAEIIDPASMRIPEPAAPLAGELAPKTPAALRDYVLARDRYRCLNCGERVDLHAHHIVWRSNGGPTTAGNLGTTCIGCHAMIHEGLLKMRGTAPDELELTDALGRSMSGPLRAEPPVEVSIEVAAPRSVPRGHAAAAAAEAPHETISAVAESQARSFVTFETLPDAVDARWWREHAHLFDWNARRRVFEFEAGSAIEDSIRTDARHASERNPAFRPATLDDVIGQERAVRSLKRAAQAACIQGRAARHVLLEGPPGLGKTSLAQAFAAEMDTACRPACASTLEDPGVLFGILASLQARDIVFLDEIHALPREIAEFLYAAMEDFHLDVQVSEGSRARTLRVGLEPFTLIGATTDPQRMPRPLRDRFPLTESVDFYEAGELEVIAEDAARKLDVPLSAEAAVRVGMAGRGTPRHALSLVRRLVDAAIVESRKSIEADFAARVLDEDGIDENGLDSVDRRVMRALLQGGRREPMGIRKLAALVGISAATIQAVHEPFLMRLGLMTSTPRGRMATQRAAFLPQLRNTGG